MGLGLAGDGARGDADQAGALEIGDDADHVAAGKAGAGGDGRVAGQQV